MKGSAYTILYATVLGAVCALLLTAVSTISKPYADANSKLDEMRGIMEVLGMEHTMSDAEVHVFFEKHVEAWEIGGVKAYAGKTGAAAITAVPFDGHGLWGPIKGYIALDLDKSIVRAITFHEQNETPGLGGEISSLDFRRRFADRRFIVEGAESGIRIVRGGGSTGPNEVDAITGASMTCEKVEAMVNNAIRAIINDTAGERYTR